MKGWNEAIEVMAQAIDQLAIDYSHRRTDMPPDGRGCATAALTALLESRTSEVVRIVERTIREQRASDIDVQARLIVGALIASGFVGSQMGWNEAAEPLYAAQTQEKQT